MKRIVNIIVFFKCTINLNTKDTNKISVFYKLVYLEFDLMMTKLSLKAPKTLVYLTKRSHQGKHVLF